MVKVAGKGNSHQHRLEDHSKELAGRIAAIGRPEYQLQDVKVELVRIYKILDALLATKRGR